MNFSIIFLIIVTTLTPFSYADSVCSPEEITEITDIALKMVDIKKGEKNKKEYLTRALQIIRNICDKEPTFEKNEICEFHSDGHLPFDLIQKSPKKMFSEFHGLIENGSKIEILDNTTVYDKTSSKYSFGFIKIKLIENTSTDPSAAVNGTEGWLDINTIPYCE